ncbi:beta-N-acetylhexosaminidase [Membranihabitans maritimus]|uniref:beta-N-acetylhexosaminidase n=1 Tax=Membranihabitans maritimus TaxID=2904244 RepID=UPI001F026A2A|nr:family 20 glycosylhydrolase [Membranihabitans maritimus]
MNRPILLVIVLFLGLRMNAQSPKNISIIPNPSEIEVKEGNFKINDFTKIVLKGAGAENIAVLLNTCLRERYDLELDVVNTLPEENFILLNTALRMKLPDEGYQLFSEESAIRINGEPDGVFYGVQSLLQMIEFGPDGLTVPAVQIKDEPNFVYRGLMLDVARHYFSVVEIKKIIDVMASLKLNTFHWHLTDDQGWRLEIKKYPKLTEIGAYRDSTIIGQYHDFKPFIHDGERHGGYYTQEQAREIVKYASDRHITVIPEIELPGHSSAALAAYPELGCNTGPYEVRGVWGVHKTIYCPREETFEFLENVLHEVMEIFPSKYIHIGGDEAPKDEWEKSAIAQQVMKENNLEDEHQLQSWFITRIEEFLNEHGRALIGWDEILEGGLAPNATVMSWRGEEGGIAAAQEKHDVIMTPNNFMYVDYYQSELKENEPLAIGGFLPLEKVYNYHPVPESLSEGEAKYILGVQANMWTEYVATNNKLEYMLFPRAIAMAEVGWTKPEHKDFAGFKTERLPVFLRGLEDDNVFFRIPEAEVKISNDNATGRRKVEIIPSVKNSHIYYTIDDHKADRTANEYDRPFLLPHTQDRGLTLKYIQVTPGNRASQEFSIEVE